MAQTVGKTAWKTVARMRLTDSQRRKLGLAVLASLLAHALLLSLVFSGPGLGTPGLGLGLGLDLSGRDRRVEAPDVRVVLVPARVAATQPVVTLSPARSAPVQAAAPDIPPTPAVLPEVAALAHAPAPPAMTQPPDATARLGTLAPGAAEPTRSIATDKITLDPPRPATWAMPADLPLPLAATALAPAPSASSASSAERALAAPRAATPEALARIAPLAREPAVDLSQLDTSAQVAKRQIEELQAASAESARADAQREQAARQLAARQEATKQDTTKQEEAKQEAARQAAALQDTALARAAQADADTARREASRRAMGRQLDAEAARRREVESAAAAIMVPPAAGSSASEPAPLPLSWSSARRGRLLGRADPNAELVLYAEAFARKIQLNMTIDQVRDAARQRHAHPLVTVAIRQDGSVESVSFVVSSGVAQIDEAIRRIVQGQAPYPAFPPALARDFDVIEIRRTWNFDMAVRLY